VRHSKEGLNLHGWINSIGVIVALAVSCTSAYFAWQSNRMRYEDLAFSSGPSGSCRVQYTNLGDQSLLGLCWNVTISNRSEDKVSLIEHRLLNVQSSGGVLYGVGFQEFETTQGAPVMFPMTLDGGESKQFIVRAPVPVPSTVAKIIRDLSQSRANANLSLGELQNRLAQSKLDLLGDPIVVSAMENGEVKAWSLAPPFARTVNFLEVRTGRGKLFDTYLVWPPDLTNGD
jgi:hypothetical protein